ncbi:MAG: IS110 family RNA-guided transposase [Thermoleophilia bacterium]
MDKITHIGLDVHKETIAVATLRPGAALCEERVIPNTSEALRKLVTRLGEPSALRACYEAGPTGYDTQRLLDSLGVACDVIAPALMPRRPGVRIKTDRSDARNLARLHRAGELIPIRIPTLAEEALRELIRTRENLKNDRRIARQRVKSLLLKHGRRYPRTTAARWSGAFAQWARTQKFSEPAAQAAFLHLLAAEETRNAQLGAIEAEIMKAAAGPEFAPGVARLRCLRGIDTLSAITILAEVGDFRRFGSAAAFMAFTGLVPSEHSSGASVRHGSITKTGNAHLRRVLVEAAWSYRHRPSVGETLAKRLDGQPPEVVAYAWTAQCRLFTRFRALSARKPHNKAVVAVARELAGFVWGMMTDAI